MTIIDTDMNAGYSARRIKIFLNWIGSQKKVLDIGCYDGRDSELILKNNNDVYGVEILQKPAKEAKKRGIKVKEFDLNVAQWPFRKDFFDVVVAGEIIEHVLSTDLFLENIYRILKPSGILILSTPNLASLGRRIMLLLGKNPYIEISQSDDVNEFPAVGHVRYFTKSSLIRLLRAYRFNPLEVTSDRFNLGPIKSVFLARLFPCLSWRLIVKAEKE